MPLNGRPIAVRTAVQEEPPIQEAPISIDIGISLLAQKSGLTAEIISHF